MLPGSAGAAKIYFDTTASFSGVPVGPAGQAASASFHQLFVGRVNTALIGHQRPCQAFAQGAFATAGARPVVVTPGINGSFSGPDGGTHAFQGFGIYVAPVGEARVRRYSIQATDPNGQFPQNSPGNQAMTNDLFQIDSDRYLQSVSFTVTLKKNGSSSVVERSPHHYAEDWTCRNTPPPEITLEDARGRPIQRTDSPVTDNPALVGRHVYVRGRNFEPGPVTITLNGRDVAQARAHADGDFTTTFVLEAFPARDCAARVGAHQGADNVTAELPGDRQADVAAAQGGVVLPGGRGTARVGDVLCDGEDYPAIVHDAVKRPGQGLIAVMTTSGGLAWACSSSQAAHAGWRRSNTTGSFRPAVGWLCRCRMATSG